MGAIAAAAAKKDANVIPYVIRMLDSLKHRGKNAHGIATAKSVDIARTVPDLTSLDIKSNIALGHNFTSVLSRDAPQPVQDNGIKLIFEGRLFPPIGTCEATDVAKMIKTSPEEEAKRLIKEHDGSYAFVFQCGNQLIAGRDPMGLIPLYYGENGEVYALASERKALWSINIKDVNSFPPGNLAVINNGHVIFQPVKTVTKLAIAGINEGDTVEKLYGLLLQSIKERVEGVEKFALAFSGGLDSSLIAALIRECGKQVLLVIVGLEDKPEVQFAENVAEMLGLRFKAETFTFYDVENVFDEVLWLVEEPDFLKISVAIPFFWIAKTASHAGYKVLLAGQGSDELFGGYKRYLREYGKSSECVENSLYRDTILSHQVNFERDNKVCTFHGV
ncbi:MAG: asparagine synthetase B, partial [Candidatus Bathyarchaeia archaeon]